MVLNTSQLNTRLLNGLGAAPVAEPVEVYADTQRRPYRLEVHEPEGDLIFCLPLAYGGRWEKQLNKPSSLRVGYPGDDATVVASLQFPNELWLYEGDSTRPSGKFRILRVRFEESDGTWLDIEAYDYAEQLGREVVTAYATPRDPGTGADLGALVGDVLTAILNEQTFDPPVTKGTISPAIKNARWYGSFDGRSVLQCLTDLQEFAGGFWYVDSAHRLQWRITAGNDEGHRIRLGHNAAGVRTSLDYSELATRVVARGWGTTPETVLTVTKDDLTAQGDYGIITARVTDQSIKDMNVLEAFAQAELDRRKQARAYVDIDAIDLSKTDVYDYAFEARALVPGTRVNILSGYFDSWTRVLRVEIDLDDPMRVVIEVGNPEATGGEGGRSRLATPKDREDVAVIIAELADKIDDLQNDRGEVESVRKSLDPEPDDLTAVATWDEDQDEGNLPEKLADLLQVPYGDLADIDGAKDAIVDTVKDFLDNDRGGIVDSINAVIDFQIETGADRDALSNMSEGDIGKTTGTSKEMYVFVDNRERAIGVLRAANLTALDALAKPYELGTSTDDDAIYWYGASSRRRLDGLS